jgi:hypothetical protein
MPLQHTQLFGVRERLVGRKSKRRERRAPGLLHFSLDRAGEPDTLVPCERAEPNPTWPRNIKTQIHPPFPKNPGVNK